MVCEFPDQPCVITPIAPANYPKIEAGGPAIGRKAACQPSTRRIWVDTAFLDTLKDPFEKLALMLHEMAHAEGAKCERCADRRAGQLMRDLGVKGGRAGAAMFVHRLQNRSGTQAGRDFFEGFQGKNISSASGCAPCSGSVDEAGLCKSGSRIAAADQETARLCGCLRDSGRPADLGASGRLLWSADAGSVAALIAQKEPRLSPYAAMIVAEARATWPQAPELFAWLLASIMAGESLGNPKITNDNRDKSGKITSTDFGLMQINDAAHPDLIAQKMPDGAPAWMDPASNIHMGATVLASALKSFPSNRWAAVSAYNGGATAVQHAISSGGSPDDATAGGKYGYNVFKRILDWTGRDALDDSKWETIDQASGDGSTPSSGIGFLGGSLDAGGSQSKTLALFIAIAVVLIVLFSSRLKALGLKES